MLKRSIMRRISIAVLSCLLLTICMPVLAYAASFIKIDYDASTGNISGEIYSDSDTVGLSLSENGEFLDIADKVNITPGSYLVRDNVYVRDDVYSYRIHGNIGTGHILDKISVHEGPDLSKVTELTPSVRDDVYYSAEKNDAPPVPEIHGGFDYWYESGKTNVSFTWYAPIIFDLDHFNVYMDGVKIGESTSAYYEVLQLEPLSVHSFEVSIVDTKGQESQKSKPYKLRIQSYFNQLEFMNEKPKGYTLQAGDSLVTLNPIDQNAESIYSNDATVSYLTVLLGQASTGKASVPFTLNQEHLSASDFELVDSQNNSLPISTLTIYPIDGNYYLAVEIDGGWDFSETYILRMADSIDGDEISLPDANSNSLLMAAYLTDNSFSDLTQVFFSDYKTDLVVGDPTLIPNPGPVLKPGYGYWHNEEGTHLDINWEDENAANVDHYNIYQNGVKVGESSTLSYTFNQIKPLSIQSFEVTAVNSAGIESEKSKPYKLRVPSPYNRLDFINEKPKGYTMKAGDVLVTFNPINKSADSMYSDDATQSYFMVHLGGVHAYVNGEWSTVPFTLNRAHLTAADFQLVDSQGKQMPIRGMNVNGEDEPYLSFTIDSGLDFSETYTLQLSGSIYGDEIKLPDTVTNSMLMSAYLSDNDYDNGTNITFGDIDSELVLTDGSDVTAPAKPTALEGLAGDKSITVSWAANSEEDLNNYKIYLDGKFFAQRPADTTSYTLTGLENFRSYNVSVSAVDHAGNESPQASITSMPEGSPAIPVFENQYGFSYDGGETSLSIQWLNVGAAIGLDHFNVYQNGKKIGETTQKIFFIHNLAPLSLQSFEVTAVGTNGMESDKSDAFRIRIPSVFNSIGFINSKPKGYKLKAGDTLATFNPISKSAETIYTDDATTSFLSIGLNGVSSLNAGERITIPFTLNKEHISASDFELVDSHGTEYPISSVEIFGEEDYHLYFIIDSGLDFSETYKLRMTDSIDGDEIRLPDTISNAMEMSANLTDNDHEELFTFVNFADARYDLVVGNEAPLKPTGLESIAGDGNVTVSWTANTEADLAGYNVYRDGTLVTASPITATSLKLNDLENGKTYQIKVTAVDTAGNESEQAAVSATPHDQTAPKKPTGLQASEGDGNVTVSWTANTEADLAGYNVYRDGTLVTASPITATSLKLNDLENGKAYQIKVAAVDKSGNESEQASVSATPHVSIIIGGGGGIVMPSTPEVPGTTVVAPGDLKKDGDKVIVELGKDDSGVLLPASADAYTGASEITVGNDTVSAVIPNELITELQGMIPADALKDAQISFSFEKASEDTVKSVLNGGAGTVNTNVKLAGDVFEFTLSIKTKDGKEVKLSQFDAPITLKLKVADGAKTDLLGVYYIGDDGKLEYVGGKLVDGFLVADVSHFSKYAVLEFKKTYSDISATHWAADAIAKLSAEHVVEGVTDSLFGPTKEVTRAEFAAFLARKLNLKASGKNKFSDVASGKWYADEVTAAAEAGIVQGRTATTFAPDAKVTREEMVVMLMKAYEIISGKKADAQSADASFADQSSISAWAANAVNAASSLGMVQGREQNMFLPKGYATRAEAALLIAKL
ncbi:S-layer homology domain-containing protein [Paenibacillus lignilyticus]|uniref:S-layer homology domain-containing protein n=1 Tax=Paenibacillus lignilyticus TaxID=1172615 RepID=A0ABS5CHV2_9BACL|nr:S-layer homology domain-containing protein [Paenibacillus lignilyticus]MBP3965444.1 S-layer homology domain-containing protein [Paenibacillus lignilyticus]